MPRTPVLILLSLFALRLFAADDPFTFRGDRLSSKFTAGQERTVLTGHASIRTGNLSIDAQSIELAGKSFRYASCVGQVVVVDSKRNITIHADSMEYDRVLKVSRFKGTCEMLDPTNELQITSGYFEYDEEQEMFNMQIGVKIFKKDMICRSENAVYSRTRNSLELTGLPQVNKKKDEYRAGTIRVNLKTDEILLDGRVTGTIIPENSKKAPAAPADAAPGTPGTATSPDAPPLSPFLKGVVPSAPASPAEAQP